MKKSSISLLKLVLEAILMIYGLSACQSTASRSVSTGNIQGELAIEVQDMRYEPALLDVTRSGRYLVRVKNSSSVLHDIVFDQGLKIELPPGQTASAVVEVPKDGLSFWCSKPGHAQAGMTGVISVNGRKPAVHELNHIPPSSSSIQPKRVDPRAPPLLSGKVHHIELTALEKDLAVAKGAVQSLWTYDGQVPGPVIRVKVGDLVRVHLVNPPGNKLAHSLDFHASQVAWNDEMVSINPGEDTFYEWRADYAGVWMYHCGANPALHHIASGMYGMVIVEPPGGLGPADHEFTLVQSEFYTGDQGHETSLDKAASGRPSPDYVVFNGIAFQYKDAPIPVETGKKVRLFILNAGPNEDSAFHVVGTIFSRVIKEGIELKSDNKGHWGSQAVDLAPSQGAIVEFIPREDGLYPMVTHAFNFVGKGALGLIKAGDGDPKK